MKRNENGQFVPGESGNPNGRPPKGQALTDLLRQKIDKEEMVGILVEMARQGDFQALKYLFDRVDGAPKQTVDATLTELPRMIRFDDKDDSEDTEADTES